MPRVLKGSGDYDVLPKECISLSLSISDTVPLLLTYTMIGFEGSIMTARGIREDDECWVQPDAIDPTTDKMCPECRMVTSAEDLEKSCYAPVTPKRTGKMYLEIFNPSDVKGTFEWSGADLGAAQQGCSLPTDVICTRNDVTTCKVNDDGTGGYVSGTPPDCVCGCMPGFSGTACGTDANSPPITAVPTIAPTVVPTTVPTPAPTAPPTEPPSAATTTAPATVPDTTPPDVPDTSTTTPTGNSSTTTSPSGLAASQEGSDGSGSDSGLILIIIIAGVALALICVCLALILALWYFKKGGGDQKSPSRSKQMQDLERELAKGGMMNDMVPMSAAGNSLAGSVRGSPGHPLQQGAVPSVRAEQRDPHGYKGRGWEADHDSDEDSFLSAGRRSLGSENEMFEEDRIMPY